MSESTKHLMSDPIRRRALSEKIKELWNNQKYRESVVNGRKGMLLSAKHKRNISNGVKGLRKGVKFSDEHKEKLSLAKQGYVPWNKGKKYEVSPEAKIRLRLFARRGETSPSWKGGKTKLAERIRKLYQYKDWRTNIFTRDNFTCMFCGERGGKLEADHFPKRYAQVIQENNITTIEKAIRCIELWNISNGRTLCRMCHKSTPTYLKPYG